MNSVLSMDAHLQNGVKSENHVHFFLLLNIQVK